MGEYLGRSSFVFPEALTDQGLRRIEVSLAEHGAHVDAQSQTFTPDPELASYTFACQVKVADQMAADNTAGVVLRRALYDCGYLSVPPAPPVSDGIGIEW
ncbi:hypothetical protein GXW82_12595 [Streptacidiphilus sp. 4-A2]|nr:hypothetical protein [Streptacidiphilus sp. 4-A2]